MKKEFLADVLATVSRCFVVLIVIVLVGIACSGIRVVKSGEVALVLRFGKLVGDTAETRVCAWQERGMALREVLRNECRQRGVQLVEISGNHDPDVPALLVRFWDGKVVAMHGHALYKEVAPWSWEYLNFKAKCQELIRKHPSFW